MGDFGHQAVVGPGFCLDFWGAGPFIIRVAGKSFRFEDSDRFGPALVKANGDPLKKPWPGERSPFWRAHELWVLQGRRLEGTTAIWHEPKPTLYRKIGGRNVIVENGEPGGRFVERK